MLGILTFWVFIILIVFNGDAFRSLHTKVSYKSHHYQLIRKIKLESGENVNHLENKPQFSFGIIADIQYADADDSYNFQKTKIRRYRQSLEIFRQAVNVWSKQTATLRNAIILGDMIDARAGTENNQHACVNRIMNICKDSSIERFHFTIGNHCHYNFERNELFQYFISNGDHRSGLNSSCQLYYDWTPHPQWRFIFLDSYDVSLIGHSTDENRLIAETLLDTHNPNDLTKSGTWFDNLPFEKYRWVPYNGMISNDQVQWLREVLQDTVRCGQRVIVFCHQPVYSPFKPNSLIWNAEDILEILHESGNVVLWVAGHDHDGNYSQDPKGIHHLIPPAPIEAEEGEVAFGSIDVYSKSLVLNWSGKLPSQSNLPWPKELRIIESVIENRQLNHQNLV